MQLRVLVGFERLIDRHMYLPASVHGKAAAAAKRFHDGWIRDIKINQPALSTSKC
jgi:hypothetical protein